MKLLYTGSSGTGKTTRLIEHYLELKKDPFVTDGFFILPTSEHADRTRALVLARHNPLFNDQIVTFQEFIQHYLTERPIGEIEKQLILKRIVHTQKPKYFEKVSEFGIFYERLSALIAELKNNLLAPEQLLLPGFISSQIKAGDLTKLYAGYQEQLDQRQLLDQEDLVKLFLTKLSDRQISPPKFVLVDGFTDFTRLQEQLLEKLIESTRFFGAGVLYEEQRPRLFVNQAQTRKFFLQCGLQEQVLSENRRTTQPELLLLSREFMRPLPLPPGPGGEAAVQLLIADNRLLEIEQIASEILTTKAREQLTWSDFALIFRQIGGYKELIQTVFKYYEIPVTIHEGIYLHQNRLIAWLMTLFRLRQTNYEKELLLSFLKSAYCSLEKKLVDQLEILALKNNLWQGEHEWLQLASKDKRLQDYLEKLFKLSVELNNCGNYKAVKQLIEEYVSSENIFNNFEKEVLQPELITPLREAVLAYNKFLALLTELEYASGGSAEQPDQQILNALTQQMVTVKENPANQVQVYDALISRQKEFKVVFIPNLVLNSFPLRPEENIFIKDHEREKFKADGFNLKTTAEKLLAEDSLFYQALNRATGRLYFSYANNEAAGKKLNPSYYLKELESVLGKIKTTQRSFGQIIPDPELALTTEDYRRSLLRAIFSNFSGATAEEYIFKRKDLASLSEIIEQKNDPQKLKEYHAEARARLRELNRISVTAMENYSRCGFEFFCRHVLKIREPLGDDLALVRGNIIHRCLELFYTPGKEGNEGLDILEIFEQEYDQNKLGELLKIHPKQLVLERAELKKSLQLFVKLDLELTKLRNISVVETERQVEYSCGGGNSLTGKIDRIDGTGAERLIVDYKTGQLPAIRLKDLAEGILPQAWLYALIYSELTGKQVIGTEYRQIPKNTKKGIYRDEEKARLQVARTTNNYLSSDFDAALKRTKEVLQKYFREIQEGRFYQQRDKCNEYCAYKNICRMAAR